jgi:hypothetical protein
MRQPQGLGEKVVGVVSIMAVSTSPPPPAKEASHQAEASEGGEGSGIGLMGKITSSHSNE